MNFLKLFIFLLLFIAHRSFSQQQKELQINGIPLSDNPCAKIKLVKLIPELSAGFVCEVRDAQITEDCLELTIIYGGCNGNLELMTDNLISSDLKFNVKAKWIEPSLCKALLLTKVTFDLKPYKEFIKEKNALINIMGTTFELYYN